VLVPAVGVVPVLALRTPSAACEAAGQGGLDEIRRG
jgi:hypothetical protein